MTTEHDLNLYAACIKGDLHKAQEILEKSSNIVNKLDERYLAGNTLCHEAVLQGHFDILQLLLTHGANVNVVNNEDYNTPLHYAAKNGYVHILQLLLNHDANVHAMNGKGDTPLHRAACLDHVECIKLLLKFGANIKARNKDGKTPYQTAIEGKHKESAKCLRNADNEEDTVNSVDNDGDTSLHIAAREGDVDILQLVLNHDANVNVVDKYGDTPLHDAASEGFVECIKLLLKSGANIKARNNRGRTPYQTAIERKHKESAECLRNAGNEEDTVNALDENGYTPLHFAVHGSDVEVLQLLFNHGANVNAVDNDGCTPLHDAASYNHEDVIQLLLNQGASVNAVDKDDFTPMHVVAYNNCVDVIPPLLSHGANVNAVSNCGTTPLHRAAYAGHVECIKFLLKSGANIKARDNVGKTPYRTAIEGKHKESAECLRNAGNEEDTVDSVDNDGDTSLHIAARVGDVDILQLVLNHGANVNVVDKYGDTPLHDAAREGHVECVKLLLKSGANIKAKNKDGKTPYQTAIENKHKESAECLRNTDDEEDEELMSSSEDEEEDEELMSSSEGEEKKEYRRAYLEALKNGKAKNNRIPIMLIGQDRAGKTSLMTRLQGLPFNKDQPSTIGIDVNVIELTEQNAKEPWRAREVKEFMTSESEAETAILKKATEYFDSRFQRKLEGDAPELLKPAMHETAVMPVIAEKLVKSSIKLVPTEVISKMETHIFTAHNQEKVLRVFLADFAGQKIYYDTHGCFVKPHCAYVLVHDLSLEFDEPAVLKFKVSEKEKEIEMNNPYSTTNLDKFKSWLKFLQGLGKDEDFLDKCAGEESKGEESAGEESKDEEFELPPVVIALTHCDEVEDAKKRKDVERRIKEVLKAGKYRNVFSSEFFWINNTLKDDEGDDVQKLRRKLFDLSKAVLKQEKPMPLEWLNFEAALRKKLSPNCKYIAVDEAKKVAEDCGTQDFDQALKFLHHLGAVVYHSGSNKAVLDPPWLMNLFTTVISIPEKVDPMYKPENDVLKDKGILFKEYLKKKAPLKDVELLEELMEKFNLISPCQHEGKPAFYVPSLAPLMPKKELKASTIPSLFVTFPLQFVPMGLFTKLQVKLISEWKKSFPNQQVKPSFYCNYSMLPLIIDEDVYDVHLIEFHEFIKVTVLPDKPDGNHLTFARHFLDILKRCLNDLRDRDQLLFSMTNYDLEVKCTCCFGKEEKECFRHHKTQCDSDRCGHFLELRELQKLYGNGSSFRLCRSDPRLAKKFDIKTVEIWLKTGDNSSKRKRSTSDTSGSQEGKWKRKKPSSPAKICKTCKSNNETPLPRDRDKWSVLKIECGCFEKICKLLDLSHRSEVSLTSALGCFDQDTVDHIEKKYEGKGGVGIAKEVLGLWGSSNEGNVGAFKEILKNIMKRVDVLDVIKKWEKMSICHGCGKKVGKQH